MDRASYRQLLLGAALLLAICTAWFRFAPTHHGLTTSGVETRDLFDCLYFSVVTFTSLGYGELLPVGWGRLFALCDVVAGLALTAVFIGKLASERQASLLFLLHSSDVQRRMAAFAREFEDARLAIHASGERGDVAELRRSLPKHAQLTRIVRSYLLFNAHQARVVEFGDFTALNRLYDEIEASFEVVDALHRKSGDLGDAAVMRESFKSMEELCSVVRRMRSVHSRAIKRPWYSLGAKRKSKRDDRELSPGRRLDASATRMEGRLAQARQWIAEGFHPVQIERVRAAFPEGGRSRWQTGMHKALAQDLCLSNSLVTKCIDELIRTGRLP